MSNTEMIQDTASVGYLCSVAEQIRSAVEEEDKGKAIELLDGMEIALEKMNVILFKLRAKN